MMALSKGSMKLVAITNNYSMHTNTNTNTIPNNYSMHTNTNTNTIPNNYSMHTNTTTNTITCASVALTTRNSL
jgi:hypothetical protein